jgi:hypothetical protein
MLLKYFAHEQYVMYNIIIESTVVEVTTELQNLSNPSESEAIVNAGNSDTSVFFTLATLHLVRFIMLFVFRWISEHYHS